MLQGTRLCLHCSYILRIAKDFYVCILAIAGIKYNKLWLGRPPLLKCMMMK